MKRILVCGDRSWSDIELIEEHIKLLGRDTLIIHGDARGADRMAGALAEKYGLGLHIFPADWELYGRKAGPIRNRQMLKEGKPHEVWAFHNNIRASKGTKDMVRAAKKAGITTTLITSRGWMQHTGGIDIDLELAGVP